jgi:hypothetical protein
MGRSLKNHDAYLDKLKAYAQACEITVEWKNEDGDGAYIPSLRKIKIDPDLPDSTEIATLLHELGHSLDDTLYSKSVMRVLDRAYKAVYHKKPTQQQLQSVLDCEKRAWTFGRSIAKKLRIPLGKWYAAEEAEALKIYGDTETQNR